MLKKFQQDCGVVRILNQEYGLSSPKNTFSTPFTFLNRLAYPENRWKIAVKSSGFY
jgi:hypothetical protein